MCELRAAYQQITAAYQRYLGRAPPRPNWRPRSGFPIPRCAHRPYSSGSWAARYFDRTGDHDVVSMERVFTEITGRPTGCRDGSMDATFRHVNYSRSRSSEPDDRRRTLRSAVAIARPADLFGCSGTGTTRPSGLAGLASASSDLKLGFAAQPSPRFPLQKPWLTTKTA